MTIQDQESFREAQAKLDAKEDLAHYMGKWVALRGGKVVASDLSLSALRRQSGVKPSDVFMPVPRTRAGFFIG